MKTIARFLVRRSGNAATGRWFNLTTTTLAAGLLLTGVILRADPCVITNESGAFAIRSSAIVTNGQVTLAWESCNEHLYEVQTSPEFSTQAVWTARALVIGGDGSTTWLDTNAPAQTQRFYRVQRLSFSGDQDRDEYTNLQEYRLGTAPNNADSHPTTIPPGLRAWWKFDEGGGSSLLDSSFNGHDAVIYGPASSWTNGVLANALAVNMKTNNYIEATYDTSLTPAQTFSLTGWIKTTVNSYDGQVQRYTFAGSVATGWDVNRQHLTFQLWTDRGDVFFWQRSCPNITNIASGRLVNPYQWHLLAAVCSPTNVILYVDGRFVTNRTVNCPSPVTKSVQIGGRLLDPSYYDSEWYNYEFELDDIRIYSRALDAAEIQTLYSEDTDSDRIPNWWMSTYLGHDTGRGDDRTLAADDYDGDGYSNLQEYQLRTRPTASYSYPADPPRNLVAWWKLDEGTVTTVFDSSLNGHHGFLLGGNAAGSWTIGYHSNAVTLGGTAANWIQVPYQPGLTPAEELTLTGWVKPFGRGILMGNWDSAGQVSGNYRLQFGPDQIELWFSPAGSGPYQTLQFNPNWSTNEWHHVAVSYGGDTLAVFVDGELRDSRTVTGPLSPAPNPVTIGFPGVTEASAVDDVRLYNRALGTNEIASLSRRHGLPVSMVVGQTARLRAFGASEGDTCQWTVVSGKGFFTNTNSCMADFRPSWSGAVTVEVVYARSGNIYTNRLRTVVAFPSLSPISSWDDQHEFFNNCYNFATDIQTDSYAQPGGKFYEWDCPRQTSDAIADGLRPGVDLDDLCHTSGLPEGHIVALLTLPPNTDYHWVRMEADGTWSGKYGTLTATALDNAGLPIADPRTAYFVNPLTLGVYQFCGFFWVGPDVHIH